MAISLTEGILRIEKWPLVLPTQKSLMIDNSGFAGLIRIEARFTVG